MMHYNLNKYILYKNKLSLLLFLLFNFNLTIGQVNENGRWIKTDFHIHTTMSDGDVSPVEIAKYSFEKYELDAIAITDHGGHFFRVDDNFNRTDDKNNIFPLRNYDSLMATDAKQFKNYSRSIQLLEKSFPEVLRLREIYKDKLIIQGIELNVPGHDHACVGIISETGIPISDFQFTFDRNDTLKSFNNLFTKQNANIHPNALISLNYLQNKYPNQSYFIINHPSRKLQYKIEEIRDFVNVAPNIAVGFEGLPGHQKTNGHRCKYGYSLGDQINYHSKTYGGADFMLSKIGGVWDAILGEGRKFWVFANSDFHRSTEDSWPGEYAKNYLWVNEINYSSLIEGLHKGKIFAVTGDLVSEFNFNIHAENVIAEMGQTLSVDKNSLITIRIGFKSPSKNNYSDSLNLDHIDLICGDIRGIIQPDSDEYKNPVNSTTEILKTFSSDDWKKGDDGINYISYSLSISNSQYFRLRGTNIPINTQNETDEYGNPLCDILIGDNNEESAWKDLWFYSNPIFVEVNE